MPKDLQVQITSSRTAIAWWRGVKTDRKIMRGKFLGYKVRYFECFFLPSVVYEAAEVRRNLEIINNLSVIVKFERKETNAVI